MGSLSFKPVTPKDRQKYVRYLAPHEELMAVCGISKKFFRSMFISSFVLALFVIGVPKLIRTIHRQATWRYLFTNRRLIIKRGLFAVSIMTVPLDKISHLSVRQTVIERLAFGDGTVVIHTAGPTPIEMVLEHIENPFAAKNLIESLMHNDRIILTQTINTISVPREEELKEPLVRRF